MTMETQKGSSSFRMRLARVSVDGDDEPIAREATLRLQDQQDQGPLHTTRKLMDIHIDGKLMVGIPTSLILSPPFSFPRGY